MHVGFWYLIQSRQNISPSEAHLRYYQQKAITPTCMRNFPPVNMIMSHDASSQNKHYNNGNTSRPFSDSLAFRVVVIFLIIRAAANVNERTWWKYFGLVRFEKSLSKPKFQLIYVPAVWLNALLSQTRIMEETCFTDTWEFKNEFNKTWSKCN